MRDDYEWGILPGAVPPASTPADSTPARTPVSPPPRSLNPILVPSPVYPPVVLRSSTPFQYMTPGVVPSSPLPLLFSPVAERNSPRVVPSPLDPPVVPPHLSSPALHPSSPRIVPSFSDPPVVPPHLSSPAIRSFSPARHLSSPRIIPSPLDPPVVPPTLHPSSPTLRPSSSPRLTPNRNSSAFTAHPPSPMLASTPNSHIFIPPSPQLTPPPPQPIQRPRRVSGPLIGERQGWAYPLDLGGTGLSYPNHSTPYNPYTPLPTSYSPYLYPPYLPSFTPQPYPTLFPYSQYRGPQPLPPYATPIAPVQVSLTINTSPWLPPTSRLPEYALPADTPLGAASVPLPPPQPSFVSLHPDIFALGGGLTALNWDLLYPPTPEYAKLISPPTPYARPSFSDPAFSSPMTAVKVHLRSSSHPVLAYWMDIWGPFTIDGVPTVGSLLGVIYDYLHQSLTSEELDLLVSTPENKENVVKAKQVRVREGCELVLEEEGYKRLDVLGMHRKFAGCWVGSVFESESGPESGIDVELMVGVRPVG
ncbi:hypothetical protein L218DRAFT_986580 [Marasmius fiardii PR-910]|nr:hypothetical protein L218DRAFT_986580 [Marasmius fiardii PR-910]